MISPHNLKGIFVVQGKNRRLCTRSFAPGPSEFDEFIIHEGGDEFRVWDPSRSKLAAALVLGCRDPGIRPGDAVMYLGASHGYTTSFVSDIIGKEGIIFALDFAPRVVRDCVFLSLRRSNIAPIMGDAHHPERYMDRACQVDWIYQDVAQKDQVGIFLKNIKMFLRDGGYACLALKARSIDVAKKPREVFAKVRAALDKEVTVIEAVELDPLQKGHCFFVVRNEKRKDFFQAAPQPVIQQSAQSTQKSSPQPAVRQAPKPQPLPAARPSSQPQSRPAQHQSPPPQQKRWLGQKSDPKYAGKPLQPKKPQDKKPGRYRIEPL